MFRDLEHMMYIERLRAGFACSAEEKAHKRVYCHLQMPNGAL